MDRRGPAKHLARNGLIAVVVLLAASYLAVTKELPFTSKYEIKAVFANGANIRPNSPVRIAGVNVGEVQSVQSKGDSAEVTFTVTDEGRPIRDDAQVSIRPRIFLEGNFFLDVRPGSPSASEIPDGGTIPITQTSTAVQIDQILTALQAPDRRNLQDVLIAFGGALNDKPRPADDRNQDPDVRGKTAGQAIGDSFRYGGPAGRDTAIVSQALQGTEPHDLSNLISDQATIFTALASREGQLQDLVTNLNTTLGAFAAESDSLGETVRLLAPTLETADPALLHLNASFPALRAFARDIRPGIEAFPKTITAGTPWLRQARALLKSAELGGVAKEVRLAAPSLGGLGTRLPPLLSQFDLLARCTSHNLIPAGDAVISDSGPGFNFTTGVPNYKEFLYAAVGSAGESQSFDGNGPYLRFQTGGGPTNVRTAQPGGGTDNAYIYGKNISPVLGSRPALTTLPPFRTDVPCAQNAVPDLNGSSAAVGPPSPTVYP